MFEKEPIGESIQKKRIDTLCGIYDEIEKDWVEFDLDGSTWTLRGGRFSSKLLDTYNPRALWACREDFDGRFEEFEICLDPTTDGKFESSVVMYPEDVSDKEAQNWKIAQQELGLTVLNNEDWERIDEVVDYLTKRKVFNDFSKSFTDPDIKT
jgi:hypothetical protein